MVRAKALKTVKEVPAQCISEFRVRALENSFTCTCGGKLVITRKTGMRQTFVCKSCHQVWVLDFVRRCITEGGK